MTPDTEASIKIVRDQIGGPLAGAHRLATDVTDVMLGIALQRLGAWLVLIERKMLNAITMMAFWAASRGCLFTRMAGLLCILLKHQDTPPDLAGMSLPYYRGDIPDMPTITFY